MSLPHTGQTPSEVALEEYKAVNEQIGIYLNQRTAALAVVAAGVGAILMFGGKIRPVLTVLALFSVILTGALITWNSCFQAIRRIAYLIVFVEPVVPGLHWNRRLREDGMVPLTGRFMCRSVTVRPVWFPNEYFAIYFLLGATASVFGVSEGSSSQDLLSVILSIVGMLATLAVCVALQLLHSEFGLSRFISRWEFLKEHERIDKR